MLCTLITLSQPTGCIACTQNFPDSYLHLPDTLNDPFCCMTLLAFERSHLQQMLQRWLHQTLPMLLNGPDNPRKLPLSIGDCAAPSNIWFLGPTRVFIQNSMSIASAVFVQLTVECPIILQCATSFPPQNCPSHWGIGSPI